MNEPTLTKEEEDKILKEINYSRAQLKSDLITLRKWLEEQQHLPACRLKESDIFLSNFLVGCKGSMQNAKRKIDHYYSMRGKGDVFMERDNFDYFEKHSQWGGITTFKSPEGNIVTLTRLVNSNTDVYDGITSLKALLLYLEYRLRRNGIVGQEIYMLDATGYSMSHFLKVPPTATRNFVSFFQDAYPFRAKKIVVANAPSVLASAINTVIVPFYSKKMKERITITSEPMEKLVKYVDLLPSDFEGGKQPPIKQLSDDLVAKVKISSQSFLHQFNEEVDESKRPMLENGTTQPYFGLQGSIKTLVID